MRWACAAKGLDLAYEIAQVQVSFDAGDDACGGCEKS